MSASIGLSEVKFKESGLDGLSVKCFARFLCVNQLKGKFAFTMRKYRNKCIHQAVRGRIKEIPIDFYLFVFVYFTKIVSVLIVGGVLGLSDVYQHEILLIEKWTYFILVGYISLHSFFYIIEIKRWPYDTPHSVSILFFIVAVASTIFNMGQELKYDYFTKLALMELMQTCIFMFHVASSITEEQFWKLFRICGKGIIYIILFLNIISLLVFVIKPSVSVINICGIDINLPPIVYDGSAFRQYNRFAGFYSNTNTCGVHSYLGILLSIIFLKRKEMGLIEFLVTTLSCLFFLYVSHSRTGIVVLGFMMFYLVVLFLEKKMNSMRKALLLSFCAVVILGVFTGVLKYNKLVFFAHTFASDPFTALDMLGSYRLSIVTDVISKFQSSPLIGVGWNVKFLGFDSAHNVILTVLAWTGITGLILFVSLLILVIKRGIQTSSIKENPLLFMLPLCVFVQCMFEQGIIGDKRHAYTYLFWLVLGFFGRNLESESKNLTIEKCESN